MLAFPVPDKIKTYIPTVYITDILEYKKNRLLQLIHYSSLLIACEIFFLWSACFSFSFLWWLLLQINTLFTKEDQTMPVLSHCGLVTALGSINLGQRCLRKCLVAWQHLDISWVNGFCGMDMKAINHKLLMISICEMSLKMTFFKIVVHFPGSHELNDRGK